MAEDEDAKLAQQADEMAAVAERLNSANIAGVRAAVGDDHGKSPTVDISLVEGEWRGPTGPELLLQLRDERLAQKDAAVPVETFEALFKAGELEVALFFSKYFA